MSNHQHDFLFDVNFGMGDESVFTLTDHEQTPPVPPVVGYFLLLDNSNFLLLDGERLTLL